MKKTQIKVTKGNQVPEYMGMGSDGSEKHMRIITSHNYPKVLDGRNKVGRIVKKISKILYPVLLYPLIALGVATLVNWLR